MQRKAEDLLLEYQKFHGCKKKKGKRKVTKWVCPPQGHLKINVDGSFQESHKHGGIGVVVRNEHGVCMAAFAQPLEYAHTALQVEAEALRAGILIAIHQGWEMVEIESNCSMLVDAFHRDEEDLSMSLPSFSSAISNPNPFHRESLADKVSAMPLLSKAGSILRQTATRQVKSELLSFKLSIHQAIRCTSSMGSSEALRGETVMDRDTGRSTGLGFITSSAIQPLGRQELHGHQVRMNFAADRTRSNFGAYGVYTGGVVGYYGQHGSGYDFGVGYGLRSYGGGAGDKVLSTGKSSNNGPVASVGSAVNTTIGSAVNTTIGSADKIGVGQRNSFSSGATANTGGAYEIAYTRSGASTANEAGVVPNTLRPLSPHLPMYKPQINSTFSILDRIAASYLTALFVVYSLVCLKMGPICFTFEPFYKFLFYSVNLVPLSLELAALAMAYHTYHGICHLWAIRGSKFLRSRK
ncbi:hypothetical protein ACLB2K_013382 [Fragaria x ananassa]